jgi:hypothetical protein
MLWPIFSFVLGENGVFLKIQSKFMILFWKKRYVILAKNNHNVSYHNVSYHNVSYHDVSYHDVS